MATTNQQQKQQPSFQNLVAANRSAGRLDCDAQQEAVTAEERKAKVQTGMRLTPDEFDVAKALADADGRSISGFARRMYLRGLAAYMAETSGTTTAAQ